VNELLTKVVDPYQFQPVKHRNGLEAVAEAFLARPIAMPIDVHDLFQKYLEASETVIVPRLFLLQLFYDLNRAWETTGRDESYGSHGHLYRSFRDIVSNVTERPSPFQDLAMAKLLPAPATLNSGRDEVK
jgi:hypothetical protein